jgi:hypothetical protein
LARCHTVLRRKVPDWRHPSATDATDKINGLDEMILGI